MEPDGPSKQEDGASDDANRLDAPLSLSDIKQASLHPILQCTLGGDTRQSQPGLLYNSKCRIQQIMQGEAVSLAATERDCLAGMISGRLQIYRTVILRHLILPPDLWADSLLLSTEDPSRILQLRSRQTGSCLGQI